MKQTGGSASENLYGCYCDISCININHKDCTTAELLIEDGRRSIRVLRNHEAAARLTFEPQVARRRYGVTPVSRCMAAVHSRNDIMDGRSRTRHSSS